MRPFLLLSLVPPLLMAQSTAQPGDFCRVEGQVSSSVTREPVRKAAISLARAGAHFAGASPAAYHTESDPSGHFAFDQIEPGQYRLRASRNGYVTLTTVTQGSGPPAAPISLAPGQHLDGITLKLTPHAAISGRVLEEDGEPVPNARVVLLRDRYLHGLKQLSPAGPSAVTNDLGEYRVFGVPPGKYFLSVTPGWTSLDTPTLTPAPAEYVTTYFPGAIEPAAAAPLDLAAGSQLTGIHVTLSKVRTVHVSGHVIHAASQDQTIRVYLTSRAPAAPLPSALAGSAGAFDIANVTPGSYNLVAVAGDGSVSRAARMPLEVKNADLENLSLTISAGIAVNGYLRAETGSSRVDLSGVTVTLQPRDPQGIVYGETNPRPPNRDGAFSFTGVAPDTYDLSVSGLVDGDYVKSIRVGAVDVLASGLDLTSGAAPAVLEVAVNSQAAALAGIVRNPPGSALAPGATVVLVPQERQRRGRRDFYRTAVSDLNGAFSLTSLPPGDYLALAWLEIEGEAWLDPEFLKPFEKSGEPVSLREGDRKSVNLNLLPASL